MPFIIEGAPLVERAFLRPLREVYVDRLHLHVALRVQTIEQSLELGIV